MKVKSERAGVENFGSLVSWCALWLLSRCQNNATGRKTSLTFGHCKKAYNSYSIAMSTTHIVLNVTDRCIEWIVVVLSSCD